MIKKILLLCTYLATCWAACPTYTPDTRSVGGTVRDVWGCGDRSLPGFDQNAYRGPYPACGSQLNAGETPPICTVAGSGWQCAQDFERANGNDQGMVTNRLDPVNRVPVLNPSSSHPTVINAAQFAHWYINDPLYNIPITIPLDISNAGTCDSLIYQYDNQNFYPIDGRGFGNYYAGHNYGFTFVSNLRFTYQGFETFDFTGDDDVFVYINNMLALDLGGVHGAESATIDLNWPAGGCAQYNVDPNNPPLPCVTRNGPTGSIPCACVLGIAKGTSYTFDLFYNERHTTASDLKFTTSLFLQCPYYDHCRVCQGDGQSCCTCTAPDLCHTTKCDVTTSACINTPKSCPPPPNKCQTATCDGQTGLCGYSPVVCNDNNICTTDSCTGSIGCQYLTIDCNDNNSCTADTCDRTLGCQHTPIAGCDAQCQQLFCPASDKCTNRACDPSTKQCGNTTVVCNDNNLCTRDSCNPSTGCKFDLITCDDHNPCTIDSCDITLGCVFTTNASICDDSNVCTNDICANITSSVYNCSHTDIPVPAGDFCKGIYCDPKLGIVTLETACPSACQGACDPTQGCQKCPGSRFGAVEKAAVGIGAGAVAGIAIGGAIFAGLAFFGGKKGYDAYKRNKNNMQGAQTSPMYHDNGRTGVNPFYSTEMTSRA